MMETTPDRLGPGGQPAEGGDATVDPRLGTVLDTYRLDALIGEWTRQRTVADVDAIMAEAGVPAGPIYRPDGMVHDPQFIAREAIHWEQHDSLGRIPMPNVMPKLSATPGSIRRPAPDTVGQHTDEVLAEVLGLDSAAITALRDAAVI